MSQTLSSPPIHLPPQVVHDPVTFKTFNEHTHIVAIRTSGNVFARETIDRLNIKPGHWRDLVTDEAFTRKDIITLQDPLNVEGRDCWSSHSIFDEPRTTS